jgi:hypothetical protein
MYCREQEILVVNVISKFGCIVTNLKKIPCLIMSMSTKCQKIEKKMTINVIQHDYRL